MTALRLILLAAPFTLILGAESDPIAPTPDPAYQPLAAKERWQIYIKRSFGPEAWARTAIVSGWKQARDEPPEWQQGMAGYGRRYASGFSRHLARTSIEFGFGAAIGEDPRYERSNSRGFFPRVRHAAVSTFVARNRKGDHTLAVARLTGIYAAPLISLSWYPKRYTVVGDGLRWGTLSVGFNACSNVFREFWPDIRRAIRK